MAAGATLVLRDIHQPPAPPWWPPAPGWWLLAALVVAAVLVWGLVRWRRRRRSTARAAVFDAALAAARTPSDEIAAMSELLRRAARQRDPSADRLQGEAWLAWLDGDDAARPFSAGAGRWLLDGGFRNDVEPAQAAALRPIALARFQALCADGAASGRHAGVRGLVGRVRASFSRTRKRGDSGMSGVPTEAESRTSRLRAPRGHGHPMPKHHDASQAGVSPRRSDRP